MHRFYKPDHARFGDTIPFFWDGEFHIYYLKRYADDTHDTPETHWWHISTVDFVNVTEHGIAIRRGGAEDPDYSAATGSVVRIGDEFHAYYTGFRAWPSATGRHQTVLRARSRDLVAWTKDPDFALLSDTDQFDADEWRDPFVFRDDEQGGYRMLIAAQRTDGPATRRGATAMATSPDGQTWTVDDRPFWSPGLYSMHECPDLFRLGDYWYLVYSTLTDRTVTRYRMSRSIDGPWVAPPVDELDGLGLYAGKTVSDGEHRYLVGWATNRVAGHDDGAWLWGGNLVAHEITAAEDGTLRVRQPAVARAELERRAVGAPTTVSRRLEAPEGYASVSLAPLPRSGFADLRLHPEAGARAFGVELRVDDDRRHGYSVTFEPATHRVVVDRLDRFGFDRPLDILPMDVPPGPLDVRLEFDGELFVLYVDGRAITVRGYDVAGPDLAVFAVEGSLSVDCTLHRLPEPGTPDGER
ncbi:hypothetical protein [Propionicimonas sp.]|uniref:hypothetical protein n=1 Tax=Propionicimonas sp. TaxID=1955623 RepID=UPI0039E71476